MNFLKDYKELFSMLQKDMYCANINIQSTGIPHVLIAERLIMKLDVYGMNVLDLI